MAASPAAEELMAPQYATVMGSRIEPVTLALASTKLAPLKARQSAVAELRTRTPKIPVLSRAPLRLKVVKEARAIIPSVRAFDDPKAASPAIAAPSVPEPLMMVVSLDAQKLDIYRGITHVASAKISSGMPGFDTRMGVFSILEKKRRHHSNLYSGAPMPFMQRLTRSGTALHAGAIPGYPASHGCVRLPYSFAPKLFEMTSVGQTVAVTRSRPVPARIEHPNLFQLPSPNPQMAMAADTAASEHRLSDAVDVATTRTNEDQDHEAAFRSDAPLRMLVTRRTAHDRVIAVQYLLADMGYLPRQNFSGAIGAATRSAIRAFQRTNGLPETGAFTDELVRQVYGAAGKIEPPEGHLYVRQDFSRVFDVAVAFRDPAVSLGTHVFTVVKRADPEAKPEWMVVSLEGGDAASVLDRIDIPDGVRRSIAPRLKPGSTLIIADKIAAGEVDGHHGGIEDPHERGKGGQVHGAIRVQGADPGDGPRDHQAGEDAVDVAGQRPAQIAGDHGDLLQTKISSTALLRSSPLRREAQAWAPSPLQQTMVEEGLQAGFPCSTSGRRSRAAARERSRPSPRRAACAGPAGGSRRVSSAGSQLLEFGAVRRPGSRPGYPRFRSIATGPGGSRRWGPGPGRDGAPSTGCCGGNLARHGEVADLVRL